MTGDSHDRPRVVVVGIGRRPPVELGLLTLAALDERGCEIHLVASKAAEPLPAAGVPAVYRYASGNHAARIASGSFRTAGMIVAPCDAELAGAISRGLARDLLERAADVTIKERRRLVLLTDLTAAERDGLSQRFEGTRTTVVATSSQPQAAVTRAVDELLGGR